MVEIVKDRCTFECDTAQQLWAITIKLEAEAEAKLNVFVLGWLPVGIHIKRIYKAKWYERKKASGRFWSDRATVVRQPEHSKQQQQQ